MKLKNTAQVVKLGNTTKNSINAKRGVQAEKTSVEIAPPKDASSFTKTIQML
jgi:hypothetical protein